MSEKDKKRLSKENTQIQTDFRTISLAPDIMGFEEWSATDIEELVTQPRPNPKGLELDERYKAGIILGIGGMGEVYRVFDEQLRRHVAMKVIRKDLSKRGPVVARFIEEAQICAQLQHPNIIPIYDIGNLKDGRPFFTMKEVEGVEFSSVIERVHDSTSNNLWGITPDGWTFRRLIEVYAAICDAMAYAHERGVIHRDLKPSNVMVNSMTKVIVMDWGIAKIQGKEERIDMGVVVRSSRDKTRMGAVTGTPSYMSPEQAKGLSSTLTASADVFSLGSILYTILTGGPPIRGAGPWVMEKLRADVQITPPTPPAPIPAELSRICMMALQMDPNTRIQNAGLIANEIRSWLDGDKKREQALELVAEAISLRPAFIQSRATAKTLLHDVQTLKKALPAWAPIEDKQPLWDLEDKAKAEEHRAKLIENEFVDLLHTALMHSPNLPKAHIVLADHYYACHKEAEAAYRLEKAKEIAVSLRLHDNGRYQRYLSGEGRLSLLTTPVATATLYRYEEIDRRLKPTNPKKIGKTPLVNEKIPMGSYLVELTAPNCETTLVPIQIERTPIDSSKPHEPIKLTLPPKNAWSKDEAYIPPGWATLGADDQPENPSRKEWIDGFIMKRYPVTNRQYLEYLNALSKEGRLEEAIELAPKERGGNQIFGLTDREWGKEFVLVPDSEGDLWNLDWPVMLISFNEASKYAEWLAQKEKQPWRLPIQSEWEKAARGVDGRFFPWGYHFDATWTCCRESKPGRPLPAVISEYEHDVSPYGIRGLGGNVQDWCVLPNNEEEAAYRGGAWSHHASFVPSSRMNTVRKEVRTETAGLRLVRSYSPGKDLEKDS